MLRLVLVRRRSCRRYVRNTLRNGLVRWFTPILTRLAVLPFQIILASKCTTSRPWFLPCRCGALRSSILRQRYILQIHQARWVCDVIYMRCHYYWTRTWLYFVRYMVLCFVEVVSDGYAMGRQCGLPQFQQTCLCLLFNLLLSQMYDFTPTIFTAPLWGLEVAHFKTDTSYKYSRRGGHAMSYNEFRRNLRSHSWSVFSFS